MNYFQMVNEAVDYIEENISRNIPIDELAARYQISKFYFTRIFKALTRMNVKEYIDGRRMAEAVRELETTHRRIIDIAFDTGFESHETLTRKFKNTFGMTPAQFRTAGGQLNLCKRVTVVERQFKNLHREMIVDFQIESPGPIKLVGKHICFNPDHVQDLENVNAYYRRFITRYVQGKGIDRLFHVTGGDAAPGEAIDYFTGFQPVIQEIPEGLVPLTLVASDYAVFRYKHNMQGIHRIVAGDVWQGILLSGLTLNPIGIHFFELYERTFQQTKQFLLYVPIKR
jgi:AraC family transcriptional regulator